MPTADLTPMERHLLIALQDLTKELRTRADQQDRKIAMLERQIAARDESISTLASLLGNLLHPSDPFGSSKS